MLYVWVMVATSMMAIATYISMGLMDRIEEARHAQKVLHQEKEMYRMYASLGVTGLQGEEPLTGILPTHKVNHTSDDDCRLKWYDRN